MISLMRLEIKKYNISTYIISSFIIMVSLLGLLYLFAYAPQIEPSDKDMQIFAGYKNMVPLFCVLSMTIFSTLSAIVYSKFIISEYIGKRLILMFTYPISRKKMFLAKIGVVSSFTIISLLVTNLFAFSIFEVTEQISPLLTEPITISIAIDIIKTSLIMALLASSIGIIALGLGFIKKSVPTTIVSAILLSSLYCNIVVGGLEKNEIIIISTIFTVLIAFVIVGFLMTNIEKMEVD